MSSYGMWLSASGMKVLDLRQTILANNMANSSTTGFKRDMEMVSMRQVESQASAAGFPFRHDILDRLAGGHQVLASYTDFSQGPIEHTGRPLDVAIKGKGFLAVSNGEVTRYTRAGEFTMNREGELVLSSGEGRWHVLDDEGHPIVLDPSGGEVSIQTSGTIYQGTAAVATLGLSTTDDPQKLKKTGANLFDAGDAPMRLVEGRFEPRAREHSNFDVMKGLASVIEASRAYRLNATLLQMQDQLTGQAVQTVGRIGP